MTIKSKAPLAACPLTSIVRRHGRVRQKLAALLQENFPRKGDLSLTWSAEWLYPATGAYRTNQRLDCWRWEGAARHYRPDGTWFVALCVGGYTTMTELIKARELRIDGTGEVTPACNKETK